LRPLVYRNYWVLSDKHFRRDVQLLVDELKKLLPQTPSLFPLYGITLGKTTEIELARVARRVDETNYHYYVWNEVYFWVHEGIVDDLHLAPHGSAFLPREWEKLGFRRQNSYDEWLSILKDFEYATAIVRPPSLVNRDGHDFFQARIFARKENPCPHLLELNFNNSTGTTKSAPGTLYSISIRAMENSEIDKKLTYELEQAKLYHFGYGLYGIGAEII
jgi:hypothetical protein